MDLFEQASRVKLRFDVNGIISTEQLWDISQSRLIDYEQQLTEVVESYGKSTRRTKSHRSKEQQLNELRLNIVTRILDVKEEEIKALQEASSQKEHKQTILALIKAKKEESLKNLSIEELEKMIV